MERKLPWDIFEGLDVFSVDTIGDGNCLFHSVYYSIDRDYPSKTISEKQKMAANLRQIVANNLTLEVYGELCGGGLKQSGLEEFSLNTMKKELQSRNSLGSGYIELLSKVINKDIYILEARRRNLYTSHEAKYYSTGQRNSVVMLYHDGHYESVGLRSDNSKSYTLFSPNCNFIKLLKTIQDTQENNRSIE